MDFEQYFGWWFDEHDNELLVMECEDISAKSFFAGVKAAQQYVQWTALWAGLGSFVLGFATCAIILYFINGCH